jgi:sulfatase modifying factor 1
MTGSTIRRFLGSLSVAILLTSTARAVVIQTVPVGSPGNAPDTRVMTTDGTSGYGAVPYNYRIGTYDVTIAQYAEFLNAKASVADPYGLWNLEMGEVGNPDAGINRAGSGPYSYSVKSGFANKPVLYVDFHNAVRFVNWLQNGQGNGDTESGTYTITGGASGTVLVPDGTQRMTWATTNSFHWLLPSENEWYKAAFYKAADGTYYAYPFQSNTLPDELVPPGNTNSGNFFGVAHNYDGTGSFLSDVGAYPKSLSPFGSLDMGGDVYQLSDTPAGVYYVARGGDNISGSLTSAASFRYYPNPFPILSIDVGFRVASVGGVPEPSTPVLFVIGALGLLGVGWFKRRRGEHAGQ